MQSSWIKVSPGWPDHRVNLRINPHLCKKGGIPERAKQFTFQDRLEINGTGQTVIEFEL